MPATDNVSGVVGGEYYIDTDPGIGNATSMTYNSGILSAPVGATLGVGVYQVGVRGRDAGGNWSSSTTTMLVVYDPNTTVGVTGKNRKDLLPSLANGDVLPGLTGQTPTEPVDYGFTVDYDGDVLAFRSDFMLSYRTGTQCNTPHPQNCHALVISAVSFDWLVIDDHNNSRARFQGIASVTVDGTITMNPFVVEGVDGGRRTPASGDRFTLKVYQPGADTATATPIYRVSGLLPEGNSVKIK